jgi:hypothetical protein
LSWGAGRPRPAPSSLAVFPWLIRTARSPKLPVNNMATVFAKLNLKDHKQIVVLDSPSSFESELAVLEGVEVIRDLKRVNQVTFSLEFVTTPEQIDASHPSLPLRRKATPSYGSLIPKVPRKDTSRRSTGTSAGMCLAMKVLSLFRMVAIDEDWSAKRFRRARFIKNMTRPKNCRLTERRKA